MCRHSHVGAAIGICNLIRSIPYHLSLSQRYIPDDIMTKVVSLAVRISGAEQLLTPCRDRSASQTRCCSRSAKTLRLRTSFVRRCLKLHVVRMPI